MTSADIVRTYISKITDGTLRTTQNICADDRTHLDYLYTQTRTGFLQIRSTDLVNKSVEDYRQIVLDDAHWTRFHEEKLDRYFAEAVDLSPRDASGALTPESLIRLSLGRLERQFPGGLANESDDGQFGDQDVRDLIAAKGLVVHANHEWLSRARRENVTKLYRHAVISSALTLLWLFWLLIFGNPLAATAWLAPMATTLALCFSVAVFHARSVFIRRRHRALADQFNAATRLSCATVAKCAILRQDHLIHTCHAMFEITNNGKEDYWAEGRLRRWTEVNEKWCELIFWLNGRIAANASFAFLRTKLIGMSLEGLVAQARFAALTLTIIWSAGLGVIACAAVTVIAIGIGRWQVVGNGAILLVYLGYMVWQVLRLHRLIRGDDTQEGIEELMTTDSLQKMKGYADARLHAEVAHFMKREKLKQLYAERTRLNSGVIQDSGLP